MLRKYVVSSATWRTIVIGCLWHDLIWAICDTLYYLLFVARFITSSLWHDCCLLANQPASKSCSKPASQPARHSLFRSDSTRHQKFMTSLPLNSASCSICSHLEISYLTVWHYAQHPETIVDFSICQHHGVLGRRTNALHTPFPRIICHRLNIALLKQISMIRNLSFKYWSAATSWQHLQSTLGCAWQVGGGRVGKSLGNRFFVVVLFRIRLVFSVDEWYQLFNSLRHSVTHCTALLLIALAAHQLD